MGNKPLSAREVVKQVMPNAVCIRFKGQYSTEWMVFPSPEAVDQYESGGADHSLCWSVIDSTAAWAEARQVVRSMREDVSLDALATRNAQRAKSRRNIKGWTAL
jgi:hypothetical protein